MELLALVFTVLIAVALGLAGSRIVLSVMLSFITRETVGTVNTTTAVDPDTPAVVGVSPVLS